MTEILGEMRLKIKNQVTVPKAVVEILNLKIGDFIRFEQKDNGEICLCKSVTHKVNNNCGGKK